MKTSLSLLALLLAGCANYPMVAAAPAAASISAATPVSGRQGRGAAPDAASRLKNPSFNPDPKGKISDWEAIEHGAGHAYTFVADPEKARSMPSSARIRRHGVEPFGSLQQTISVHPSWHNKTARLTGWLRGEAISGAGGALTLRADGGSGQILGWNYMPDGRVEGTQDWKPYAIELKIPPASYLLTVGVILEGGGTLWADDLSIELID